MFTFLLLALRFLRSAVFAPPAQKQRLEYSENCGNAH
jgi:hypothetical protein